MHSPIRSVPRRGRDHRGLNVARWHGEADVVVVTPRIDQPPPGVEEVALQMHHLAITGVRRILTGALHTHELGPFLANGFSTHEHLVLLRHDLDPSSSPPAGGPRIRRAWRRDHADVLLLDNRAFDQFWALDEAGLNDAVAATPITRFRVASGRRGGLVGYAVTGRAGDQGYLQRLAVDPDRQRHGTATALVADSLAWLRRNGARAAVVNTQDANLAALALYERCGFTVEPSGLTVLARDLTPGHASTAGTR